MMVQLLLGWTQKKNLPKYQLIAFATCCISYSYCVIFICHELRTSTSGKGLSFNTSADDGG